MTENEITETLKTVVNHPIYKKFTDEEILKLAYKKLNLHHIARVHGLKLENIFKQPEKDFWIAHISLILRHHRSIHKDEFLPSNLPSGTRVAVADHLIQYFTNWIEKSFSFIPISKYFSVKCLKS